MHWQKAVFCFPGNCIKNCPHCARIGDAMWHREKSPVDFVGLLQNARSIPHWTFALPLTGAEFRETWNPLFQTAWDDGRKYDVVTPYENLGLLDSAVFRNCRTLLLPLDEYQISAMNFYPFYRALSRAEQKGFPLEVIIQVTEPMLHQVLHSLMLERLLAHARKIHFRVLKNQQTAFMHREQFGVLLDFLANKMRSHEMARRLEIEPCLLPVLMPWPIIKNPVCPNAHTFTIFADGRIQICPHGTPHTRLLAAADLPEFLAAPLTVKVAEQLQYCQWREIWKAQEASPDYDASGLLSN